MIMGADFNKEADELIVARRYAEPQALLEAALGAMPKGWTPKRNEGEFLRVSDPLTAREVKA